MLLGVKMHCKNLLVVCLILSFFAFIPKSYATTTYRLYVNTTPSDAGIYIMNIRPRFKQGMQLAPGKYDVIVSRKGYKKYRQWIQIRDKDVHLNVDLTSLTTQSFIQESTGKYALNVNTVPKDARIRIMNIKPIFKQGILLAPGKYDILVSKAGYTPRREWIAVSNKNVQLDFILNPKKGLLSSTSAGGEKEKIEVDLTPRYALHVDTVPSDAIVQVMNISPKFEQDMLLKSGKYYLRVSKYGYPTRRKWVEITNNDISIRVVLSQKPLCFVGWEGEGEPSLIRNVKLSFHDNFVDADYYEQSLSSKLFNHIEFKGVQQGNTLNLIGLIDYEGMKEELKATMIFEGLSPTTEVDSQGLIIDVNGNRHILTEVDCN